MSCRNGIDRDLGICLEGSRGSIVANEDVPIDWIEGTSDMLKFWLPVRPVRSTVKNWYYSTDSMWGFLVVRIGSRLLSLNIKLAMPTSCVLPPVRVTGMFWEINQPVILSMMVTRVSITPKLKTATI